MGSELGDYIKEHLERYIKYHLERGYDEEAIRRCLGKYGFTAKEVNPIIKGLSVVPQKLDRAYSDKELDAETYYYLRGIIADYIKKQQNQGFEMRHVRAALIRYGHSREIVDDAIAMLDSRYRLKLGHSTVFGALLILLLSGVVLFSLMIGAGIQDMILVMSPSIISYVMSYFLITILNSHKQYTPMISTVVAIVLFFFIFPALQNSTADFNVILALNAILAFVCTGMHTMFYTPKPVKPKPEKGAKRQ